MHILCMCVKPGESFGAISEDSVQSGFQCGLVGVSSERDKDSRTKLIRAAWTRSGLCGPFWVFVACTSSDVHLSTPGFE